jgi:hypothetical protein
MSLVDDNKLFDKRCRFSRQLFVRAHLAFFPWLSSEEGENSTRAANHTSDI